MVYALVKGKIREYDNRSVYSSKVNAEASAAHMRRLGDTTVIVKEGSQWVVYNRVAKKYGGMRGSKDAKRSYSLFGAKLGKK